MPFEMEVGLRLDRGDLAIANVAIISSLSSA